MNCNNNKLYLKAGASFVRTITITNSDGSSFDLTGKTVRFTVKPSVDSDVLDASAVLKQDITSHTNPTQGITTISILDTTGVKPGDYYRDIKIINGSIVDIMKTGEFLIDGSITNR